VRHVLIVGGGIGGLLTAWAMGRRNVAVTVSEDERFIVRPVGNRAWVISACSGHGFKLAPAMAEAVTQALVGEREAAGIPAWAAPL